MSNRYTKADTQANEAEAATRTERWISQVFLQLEGGGMVPCDNGVLDLTIIGTNVRGRHSHLGPHDVTGKIFTAPPESISLTNADGSQTLDGIKLVIGNSEFYVGRWKGPLGSDCATGPIVARLLAQDEGTWVATKGG